MVNLKYKRHCQLFQWKSLIVQPLITLFLSAYRPAGPTNMCNFSAPHPSPPQHLLRHYCGLEMRGRGGGGGGGLELFIF